MSFAQAFAYFFQEACQSLVRSWKVSLLAVLTITVSLFLGGVFLLVSGNLETMISRWRAESKIVVYLEAGAADADHGSLLGTLREAPWATGVELVSSATARQRFRHAFPSLADLLEGWGEEPLPSSFEVSLDLARMERGVAQGAFAAWIERIRADPAVSMVDDDRDWLEQLEAVVLVIQGLGMVLGAILLATAVFTISSVIRLTAYLYRDEIAVMRMVGATEFFIRGPFYLEGFLQGIVGSLAAVGALFGAFRFLVERGESSALASVLTAQFLGPAEIALLVGVGALAGMIGAVTSLRKESLGQTAEYPDWSSA
ncbi:MAG TPA: permease-like cell division protein FtsX [Thermoanaerobaculia bacterium]